MRSPASNSEVAGPEIAGRQAAGMPMMAVSLCFLFALFILPASIRICAAQQSIPFADPPPVSMIESWLLSDDPRQVAWGAHYAALSKQPALQRDLRLVADQWQPLSAYDPDSSNPVKLTGEQLDRRDAMAAVLDALIQANVAVSADTLAKVAPDFENYTAILLSRLSPEESQGLSFELYRRPPLNGPSLQYVSAALLARNPPPGFAADLFGGIKVQAHIFIVLPNAPGYGFGSSGSFLSNGPQKPREDWPNFGVYALSKQKARGAFQVLSTPDPVYAIRTAETNRYANDFGKGLYLSAEDRRRFLAYMLKVPPESIDWKTVLSESFVFRSEAQFEYDLKAWIDGIEEQYRATAVALEAEGLITAQEEEDARPSLALHWDDMRSEGYEPIPDLKFLPPRVTWTRSP